MNAKLLTRLLITLLVGSAGGLTGFYSRVPAGVLLGSMLAVGIYNCVGSKAFMPPQVRVGARIVVGSLLGLSLNLNAVMELKNAIIPALIIIVSLLMWAVIAGFIIYKFCRLDIHTAFLSCAPGGMAEFSLLAISLGGDGPKVVLLQTVRLISVIAFTPLILHVLEKLLLKGN